MPDKILVTITFLAALGSGLMAGVFFAFSTFVMRALSRLPAGTGVAAMQSINVVVINPVFLGVFLGTTALCAGVIVAALLRWDRPGAAWLIVGGASYLIGTFLVTMLCNVPLNNSLAALAPDDPDAARQWADYVSRWTRWNHVRAAAALAATGSFAMALRQ